MAEIANYSSVANESGCGFMGGIFQKWNHWPKKSHVHTLAPTSSDTKPRPLGTTHRPNTKPSSSSSEEPPVPDQKTPRNGSPRPTGPNSVRRVQVRRLSDATRTSTSSSNGSGDETKLRRVSTSVSAAEGSLTKRRTSVSTTNASMGNIVRRKSCSDEYQHVGSSLLEPEELKRMGNEAYKKGMFREALVLYDKAIALDSNKAAYHSNKSAALIGLDRVIEAVAECKEAIRIEPSFHRAHHRLATLYLRLGEAEKALYHFKLSGSYSSFSEDVDKALALQKCIVSCSEAQRLRKWNIVLSETQLAISSGANSAPLLFALQAESLLKLLRYEEAYKTYQKGPNLSIDVCTNFFGMCCCAYFLMIGSHVYLAAGRFEDSVVAAEQAAKLDPSNKEVMESVKRARAMSSARSNGNILYKAEKFSQACDVYSQGLEHDPYNSVLLCNRAACRSKLGLFEKAVEDCTAALLVHPSYAKARMRRADCNAKLERWEASIQDYEMLIRETPGDEEVGLALLESQIQLKRQRGEDTKDLKFGLNLVLIPSNERFQEIITSPGVSVVLFCNKDKPPKRAFQSLEKVGKRFSSVNFLKVEVEDHPHLVKMEGVNNVPMFTIYKNGSRVKEIFGSSHELLESSIKWYSS